MSQWLPLKEKKGVWGGGSEILKAVKGWNGEHGVRGPHTRTKLLMYNLHDKILG